MGLRNRWTSLGIPPGEDFIFSKALSDWLWGKLRKYVSGYLGYFWWYGGAEIEADQSALCSAESEANMRY